MKGVLVIEKQSHKKITDLDPLLLLQQKSKFNIDINVRDKNKQTNKKKDKKPTSEVFMIMDARDSFPLYIQPQKVYERTRLKVESEKGCLTGTETGRALFLNAKSNPNFMICCYESLSG